MNKVAILVVIAVCLVGSFFALSFKLKPLSIGIGIFGIILIVLILAFWKQPPSE